jgi:hypothetical protein
MPVRGAVWDWCYLCWPECLLLADVYGAAVCWLGVDFVCILLFCVVIMYGVKYRALEVK